MLETVLKKRKRTATSKNDVEKR